MARADRPEASWFQRFLLPGFAFKAVVIGGGYATGRELAEFFLPSGPRGGLAGMVLAMLLWSAICAVTFALAVTTRAFDYRGFFRDLLGPGWIVFEIAYGLFVVLILSVFGAAAGAIGAGALLLFYRSLSLGAMSVVAPLTAVVSAVVPVAVGLVTGDRLAPPALVGVVLSLGAVLLVGAEGGRLPTLASLRGPVLAGALAAGTGFGLWIVVLSRAPADSGFWPTAGARTASIALLALMGIVGRRRLVAHGAPVPLVVVAGCGDLVANLFFVLASREGMLSVVGVLLALYPAGTVLLALVVLKERLARLQLAGLGLAVAGVVLIALG